MSCFIRSLASFDEYIFSSILFPVTAQYSVTTLSSPPELKQSYLVSSLYVSPMRQARFCFCF